MIVLGLETPFRKGVLFSLLFVCLFFSFFALMDYFGREQLDMFSEQQSPGKVLEVKFCQPKQ